MFQGGIHKWLLFMMWFMTFIHALLRYLTWKVKAERKVEPWKKRDEIKGNERSGSLRGKRRRKDERGQMRGKDREEGRRKEERTVPRRTAAVLSPLITPVDWRRGANSCRRVSFTLFKKKLEGLNLALTWAMARAQALAHTSPEASTDPFPHPLIAAFLTPFCSLIGNPDVSLFGSLHMVDEAIVQCCQWIHFLWLMRELQVHFILMEIACGSTAPVLHASKISRIMHYCDEQYNVG